MGLQVAIFNHFQLSFGIIHYFGFDWKCFLTITQLMFCCIQFTAAIEVLQHEQY